MKTRRCKEKCLAFRREISSPQRKRAVTSLFLFFSMARPKEESPSSAASNPSTISSPPTMSRIHPCTSPLLLSLSIDLHGENPVRSRIAYRSISQDQSDRGHPKPLHFWDLLLTWTLPSQTRQPSTRKADAEAAMALETSTIDSISQNLINDLYQTKKSTSPTKVTLNDILALKPAKSTVTPEEFEKIKETIADSFNVSQLKGVLRSQNRVSGGRKSVLINQIMLFLGVGNRGAGLKRATCCRGSLLCWRSRS